MKTYMNLIEALTAVKDGGTATILHNGVQHTLSGSSDGIRYVRTTPHSMHEGVLFSQADTDALLSDAWRSVPDPPKLLTLTEAIKEMDAGAVIKQQDGPAAYWREDTGDYNMRILCDVLPASFTPAECKAANWVVVTRSEAHAAEKQEEKLPVMAPCQCGSYRRALYQSAGADTFYVYCSDCDVRTDRYRTKRQTIEVWNRDFGENSDEPDPTPEGWSKELPTEPGYYLWLWLPTMSATVAACRKRQSGQLEWLCLEDDEVIGWNPLVFFTAQHAFPNSRFRRLELPIIPEQLQQP
jgi:hypothetical protein